MSISKSRLSPEGPTKSMVGVDAKIGACFRFSVADASHLSVQITLKETAGSPGTRSVWAVRYSIDGEEFLDFSSPVTLTTGTTPVTSLGIDVSKVADIEIKNTTLSTYDTEIVNIGVLKIDQNQ